MIMSARKSGTQMLRRKVPALLAPAWAGLLAVSIGADATCPAAPRRAGAAEPLVGQAPLPVLDHAQEQEQDEDLLAQPQLGLVAQYTDRTGRRVARTEERIAHSWEAQPPDPRLQTGPFVATWTGSLSIPQPGRYRLALWCRGEAHLSLSGKEVCRGGSVQGGWLLSPPLELDYGEQPL